MDGSYKLFGPFARRTFLKTCPVDHLELQLKEGAPLDFYLADRHNAE